MVSALHGLSQRVLWAIERAGHETAVHIAERGTDMRDAVILALVGRPRSVLRNTYRIRAARRAFVPKIPRTASSRQSEPIGDYVFRAVQSPAVTAVCR